MEMGNPPLRFSAGGYSLVLAKESVREFEQSKFEYDFDVSGGKSSGRFQLWFFPSRPTVLRGRISYELRQHLPPEQRAHFCQAVFESFRVAPYLFKTYEIDGGDSDFRGPVESLSA